MAARNLADRSNVTVVNRSGTEAGLPVADAIYVNAGTPRVITHWVDALAEGGRLIFPLTVGYEMGGMLMITRKGAYLSARFTSRAAFIPCVGTEDQKAADALCDAYQDGGWRNVSSLVLAAPPDSSCWLEGEGWWLSTRGAAVDP